jgi:hypothetical protein
MNNKPNHKYQYVTDVPLVPQRYILAVKNQVNQRRKQLLIIEKKQNISSDRGGRDQPESVVGIDRNQWSRSIGNGGRHQPEYAVQGQNRIIQQNDGADIGLI